MKLIHNDRVLRINYLGDAEMEQINVREIEITDYHDIHILSKELGHFCSIEKVKDRITYITKNTKDIILVAQQNNEVIGFIHGSPYELLYSDSIINILAFVVKEEYRNIGVGSVLLKSLEDWAKEKGYFGIRLVTRFERIDAHRFYQKHGYINRKNQKNFIKTW